MDNLYKEVFTREYIKSQLEIIDDLTPIYAESIHNFVQRHYPDLVNTEVELTEEGKEILVNKLSEYIKNLSK